MAPASPRDLIVARVRRLQADYSDGERGWRFAAGRRSRASRHQQRRQQPEPLHLRGGGQRPRYEKFCASLSEFTQFLTYLIAFESSPSSGPRRQAR